jgi:uncharacterized protein YggE
MKRIALAVALLFGLAWPARAQKSEIKFIADTLVVQADGTYESDPDLATLKFDISSQDKDLKRAYQNAAQSMQRIVALAAKFGLRKEDVSTGVLTLTPSYETDRKHKPKSYIVRGEIALRVHDFSQIGPILDNVAQDGIGEFRSLTYSLQDEEGAKQRAVAEAMRRAVGRARAALEQNGQKLGAIRYASVEVQQLAGIAELDQVAWTQIMDLQPGVLSRKPAPPAPLPRVRPEKISVSATVQCAFQIQ